MAKRSSGGGLGVVAGLAAAAIAFVFWSRFLKTGHAISFGSVVRVGPDGRLTTGAPVPGEYAEYEVPSIFPGFPAERRRVYFQP